MLFRSRKCRAKMEKALSKRPDFLKRTTVQSNRLRARRKSAASEKATRNSYAKKTRKRQSGSDSPQVACSNREVRDLRSSTSRVHPETSRLVTAGKTQREILGTDSGTRNPTAIQSGNRQATLLREHSRRRQSREHRLPNSSVKRGIRAEWTEAGPGQSKVAKKSVRCRIRPTR